MRLDDLIPFGPRVLGGIVESHVSQGGSQHIIARPLQRKGNAALYAKVYDAIDTKRLVESLSNFHRLHRMLDVPMLRGCLSGVRIVNICRQFSR